MAPTDRLYTLAEIASIAGVTPRTVRYYVSQGLLPGPGEQGRGPHYDDHHLDRLRLIRELQKRHQPLAEIRRRIASMSDAQVADALASVGDTPAPAGVGADAPTSALDYIRSVLGDRGRDASGAGSNTRHEAPTPRAASLALHAPSGLEQSPPLARRVSSIGRFEPMAGPATAAPSMPPSESERAPSASGTSIPETPPAERSQWDRIALTPDIELHVRRPLSRLDNKRVERLITIARQVLQEGQP